MTFLKKLFIKPWIYVCIVLIGTCLKVYKIDYRYFWYDETWTILHTSGMQNEDYLVLFPKNEVKNIRYYDRMLHLNQRNLSIKEQFKGIWGMTNLTPLHYMFLVFWNRLAGDGDIQYRLFNFLIYLLTLPYLYLFSRQLFKSNLAAWVTLSLFSVSPFFQYFSIEARYNMLCTFFLIANQYFFLKMLDEEHRKWWAGFAITGILCLYGSIHIGLIFIANFAYLGIYFKQKTVPFLLVSFIILLAYSPWLISLIHHYNELTVYFRWHNIFSLHQNLVALLLAQVYMAAYGLVTINDLLTQFDLFTLYVMKGNFWQIIAAMLVVGVFAYSVYDVFKHQNRKIFTYISSMILIQFIVFFTLDLLRDSGISIIWRYNLLFTLGMILFISGTLASKIKDGKNFYKGVWITLIVFGIFSIVRFSDRYYFNYFQHTINNAELLSKSKNPLLISDMYTLWANGDAGGFLSMVNECNSDEIDILWVEPDVKNISSFIDSTQYSNIYVLHASDSLIANIRSQLPQKMDSLNLPGYTNEWEIVY